MYTVLSGLTVGDLIWLTESIPNDKMGSTLDISLTTAGITLSVATNAVTTTMIGYKLWYVAVGRIHWI